MSNDMAYDYMHDMEMTLEMCSEHCLRYHYFALQVMPNT